MIIFTVL